MYFRLIPYSNYLANFQSSEAANCSAIYVLFLSPSLDFANVMFEFAWDFSCEKLLEVLRQGGLHEDTITLFKSKKIAGRHLKKLLKMEDLGAHGFALGDIWDIESALQKMELELGNQSAGSTTPVLQTLVVAPVKETIAKDYSDDEMVTYADVSNYVSEDIWKSMPDYEKGIFRNKVQLYEESLKSTNITLPKPSYNAKEPFEVTRRARKRKDSSDKGENQSASTSTTRRSQRTQVPIRSSSPAVSTSREEDFEDDPPIRESEPREEAGNWVLSDKQKQLREKCKVLCLHAPKVIMGRPQFDILSILEKHSGNDKTLLQAIQSLKANGIVFGSLRKAVIRTLARHLYFHHAQSPTSVTTAMKDGMGKSLVMDFPKFISEAADEQMPWGHIYDRVRNTGWLTNASRSIQRKHSTRNPKRTKVDSEDTSDADDEDIDLLAEQVNLTMPDETPAARKLIFDGYVKTFSKRNEARQQGLGIKSILANNLHLGSYGGAVLKEEFRRMYPEASEEANVKFMRLVPKIVKLPASHRMDKTISDDTFKALMIISFHLPKDIAMRSDGRLPSTLASIESLRVILTQSDDIDMYIRTRLEKATGSVQPYLIIVKATLGTSVLRRFLVLDRTAVQLNVNATINAVDILFKAFYVFNVQFPYGWRNTFHFMQTAFYKFFEKRQPNQRKDAMTPSEAEFLAKLQNLV